MTEPIKPKTTLMQRADDQIALWQLIEETGGELCPAMESWLAEIEQNLSVKVDSYKIIIDDLYAEAERLKARSKEIAEAGKSVENVAANIEKRLLIVMQKLGLQEIAGKDYRFKVQKNPGSLLLKEDEIPANMKITETKITPDKERIKEALQNGEFIPGAQMVYGSHVRSYINKAGKK